MYRQQMKFEPTAENQVANLQAELRYILPHPGLPDEEEQEWIRAMDNFASLPGVMEYDPHLCQLMQLVAD